MSEEENVNIETVPLSNDSELSDFQAKIKARKKLAKSHKGHRNSVKLSGYDKLKRKKALKEAALAAKVHESTNTDMEQGGGDQYEALSPLDDIDEDELERAAMEASMAAHMKQSFSSLSASAVTESSTCIRESVENLVMKAKSFVISDSANEKQRHSTSVTFQVNDDDTNNNNRSEKNKRNIRFYIRAFLTLSLLFIIVKMILWTKSIHSSKNKNYQLQNKDIAYGLSAYPLPKDLSEKCALTHAGSLIHHQECLEACRPVSCCFEISPMRQCFSDNEEICISYRDGGCEFLPAKGFIHD